MYNGLTLEQHANQASYANRALGLADCIHYAPEWRNRADALYEEANTMGLRHWAGDKQKQTIGLLADGRMAMLWEDGGIAELVRKEGV